MLPRSLFAVHPRRLHARGARTEHVLQRMVADVQDLVGMHAGGLRCGLKMRRSGLETPNLNADTLPTNSGASAMRDTSALPLDRLTKG